MEEKMKIRLLLIVTVLALMSCAQGAVKSYHPLSAKPSQVKAAKTPKASTFVLPTDASEARGVSSPGVMFSANGNMGVTTGHAGFVDVTKISSWLSHAIVPMADTGSLAKLAYALPLSQIDEVTENVRNSHTLSNLKHLYTAIQWYTYCQKGGLLPFTDAASFQSILSGYVRSQELFVDARTGQPFEPNTTLAGKKLGEIENPHETILLYEATPASDGARCVLMLDGQVKRLSEDGEPVAATIVPQNGDYMPTQSNMLTNTSFEGDLSGWINTSSPTYALLNAYPNPEEAKDGYNWVGNSCSGEGRICTPELRQVIDVTPGAKYNMSVWVFTYGSPHICSSYLQWNDGVATEDGQCATVASFPDNTRGWKQLSGTVTPTGSKLTYCLRLSWDCSGDSAVGKVDSLGGGGNFDLAEMHLQQ